MPQKVVHILSAGTTPQVPTNGYSAIDVRRAGVLEAGQVAQFARDHHGEHHLAAETRHGLHELTRRRRGSPGRQKRGHECFVLYGRRSRGMFVTCRIPWLECSFMRGGLARLAGLPSAPPQATPLFFEKSSEPILTSAIRPGIRKGK